jgi:hypothetical protein
MIQFECFLQLIPVARCSELKRGAEKRSDWQNRCCMWRMRAAVDISDKRE